MRLYRCEREEYLDQLSPVQRLQYERVEMCIASMGLHFHNKRRDALPIYKSKLHSLYMVFANAMGYVDDLKDGESVAVNIAYPDRGEATWILWPEAEFQSLTSNSKVRLVANEKVVAAGLAACRSWLPNWNW